MECCFNEAPTAQLLNHESLRNQIANEKKTTCMRTLEDVYCCPLCGATAARGNLFCRGCGVRFTKEHVSEMEAHVNSPVGATPWNVRDRYKCVQCQGFVAIGDKFCRWCGVEFDSTSVAKMRANMRELAQKNWPAVLWAAVFVLIIVLFAITAV